MIGKSPETEKSIGAVQWAGITRYCRKSRLNVRVFSFRPSMKKKSGN